MIFLTQALCQEHYSTPKNLVVIQFIKYPNFEFKNWKKKTLKKSRSGDYFQTLTHDNYEKNKWYPIKIFLHKPFAGNITAD